MITDERIATYIDSLDKELPEFLRELEKKALREYVQIIKKPTQSLLRFLIQSHKPETILEVGTAVGFSSIFIISNLLPYSILKMVFKLYIAQFSVFIITPPHY